MTESSTPSMPQELPFLEQLCWQTKDVHHFTAEEALHRYERGWRYLGVLGDLGEDERVYLRGLAKALGSWLDGAV